MEIKEFIEKFAEAIEAENPEEITAETIFRDLEDWSSLSTLSLIALADEEYDVELEAADFKKAVTVSDLFEAIKAKK